MKVSSRIGAFVAATVIAVAISAAPASAGKKAPALPSVSSLGGYCKQIKDPKLADACTQVTSGKSINAQSLLGSLGGGKTGSVNLTSLLSKLNVKSGGFNIGSLLGSLGGGSIGGFNISALLAGLKG